MPPSDLVAQRPQAFATAFIRWNEPINMAMPSGTRNHDHELEATSSILELSAQSPNGWLVAVAGH